MSTMDKFNFNSQICTDRNQSERLLALGLKPETADMVWLTMTFNGEPITYPSQDVWLDGSIITNNHFPAWSLHRLLCLYNVHYLEFMGEKEIAGAYDIVIDAITQAIEGGYFNEKYLV